MWLLTMSEILARSFYSKTLPFEQAFFDSEAISVAGQISVGTEYPMAGDNQPDGVGGIGPADGVERPRAARRAGQVPRR